MVTIMDAANSLNQFSCLETTDDMANHAFPMSSDFVYTFDRLEQRYLSVNSRCLDILGYTPEQILRLEREDRAKLIHPRDLARAKKHYSDQESLADGEVSVTTFRVRHLHGDYRKLRCKQKVFSRAQDGSVKCIIGLATDITDEARRRSEIKGLRAEVRRIREFERERIAVRLHDTAVQDVVGAEMLLKTMGGGDQIQLEVRACLSRALRSMLDVFSESAVDDDANGTASCAQPRGLLEYSIERQKD
jgi:PAS domain S-box-containing protein